MACLDMKEKDCTSVFAKVVVEDKLPKFRLRLEGRRLEKWVKNFTIEFLNYLRLFSKRADNDELLHNAFD